VWSRGNETEKDQARRRDISTLLLLLLLLRGGGGGSSKRMAVNAIQLNFCRSSKKEIFYFFIIKKRVWHNDLNLI
jgi:hypothetical protein